MSSESAPEVFTADPAKHAFVTWTIAGDAYVVGALALANTIKSAGSKASTVCLISSDVSAEAQAQLNKVFTEVVVVPVIDAKVTLPPKAKHFDPVEIAEKTNLYSYAFTKLHALKLTQYEKICLLDADTICIANPDSVFEIAAPAGICTGVKNDNTQHGKPIDLKVIEKCYKESGFPGNTYLLRPSLVDFQRAIKMLAVTVKVTQVQIVRTSLVGKNLKANSAFSLLDDDNNDDDDDDDDGGADDNDADAVLQQTPRQDLVKTTKILTKEDIESTKFGDEKVQAKEYPFDVFEHEVAPLGFAFEPKKSQMGPDECLMVELYKKQWRHLHPRFGLLSWKKARVSCDPVFLHFTQKAWAVDPTNPDISKWTDLVYWDVAGVELYNKFATDKDMVAFITKHFNGVQDKVKARLEGTLLTPEEQREIAAKAAQAVETTTTTATTTSPTATTTSTTTTTTTTTTAPTPTPTPAAEPEKPKEVILRPAAVPKVSAWGKKA